MKGFNVMFNSEEILQNDIFTKEDSDRKENLESITSLLKNRYSSKYEYCRFFFSLYPNENDKLKIPVNPKKFQWMYLNSLCFDSHKLMKVFDQEFQLKYSKFINEIPSKKLKIYNKTTSFSIKYKSQVERSSGNYNPIDKWHDGFLGLNNDGIMVSILNVNFQ